MIINPLDWLAKVWPTPSRRAEVLRDYIAIGECRAFLADLALRGNLWSPLQVPGDAEATAYNIGRRDLALEIIKLAGADPQTLFAHIEKLTKEATK
jgi:hypothetical protein